MNRNHDPVESPPRFQLLRGNGEAERLDRFLAAADPLQIASPAAKERRGRKRVWGLGPVLGLLALIPLLSLSPSRGPGETAAKTLSQRREKSRLLVRQGLMAEERNAEALAGLERAARLAPRAYPSMQAERGNQRAISLAPDDQRALRRLGTLYQRQRKDRQAEHDLKVSGAPDALRRQTAEGAL